MTKKYCCPICGDGKHVEVNKTVDGNMSDTLLTRYVFDECHCSYCNTIFNVRYEKCAICGKPVCFQREHDWMPREYDVCSNCERHVCPDCSKYSDDDDGPFCAECHQWNKKRGLE